MARSDLVKYAPESFLFGEKRGVEAKDVGAGTDEQERNHNESLQVKKRGLCRKKQVRACVRVCGVVWCGVVWCGGGGGGGVMRPTYTRNKYLNGSGKCQCVLKYVDTILGIVYAQDSRNPFLTLYNRARIANALYLIV